MSKTVLPPSKPLIAALLWDRAGAGTTLGSRGCAALSRASRTQHAKQRVVRRLFT